ncbi:glycosyl hydrolase family 85-domain-containing protein [Fomitopsis serialis]|uniref:glycosyl hydrolase family 85-domain-containing protein n=1 Tax=Fomitopsis serialis TaxID=139415 RepID=UPI0020075D19|nr:glycosyl hydrolase family 85-domain-containing protein [Neoantrodia serialis]KAH9928859.1 glycosyl hydrolase family 85-domain-containing protein [Neoantrodia serialis]
MPLRGTDHTEDVRSDAAYFKTLADLDGWATKPHAGLDGVLPYIARPLVGTDASSQNRGKLLVCHDYKGGYTETPSGLAYTFNFWSYCDTFIYFSHHRVTVPPAGWINAAHRQGVKMLGTLIFEHDAGQQDCLRVLVGHLPQSKTGPAAPSADSSFPLSPHYAKLLAELAHQRGFDGYLLNVEVPLIGRIEQARALAAWISVLESELKRRIGSHAETIWYDSVVVTGDLRWQDRLNNYNLPFFLPSSGFFTNYTWRPNYPSLTAQYFFSLDPALMTVPKTLQDIYVGIDVWGRGQHGGGGFGSYRSLAHIDPEFLGLSVAFFGPGWSWETEQDKPGFSWETWWAYERKLWIGPETEGEAVEVPPHNPRAGEPDCQHGEFTPVSAFFPRQAPPNPRELPFLTYFSPGIGYAWFVQGKKAYVTTAGWTDLDKTTTLGDLVWPRPSPQWIDSQEALPVPATSTSLCLTDAWLGGSSSTVSVQLHLRGQRVSAAWGRGRGSSHGGRGEEEEEVIPFSHPS